MGQGPQDDRVIRISSGQKLEGFGWSVFARKGFLSEWRKGRQVASIDLREVKGLPGAHNHQNACAAYAACRSLGLAPKLIEGAMHSFAGLPHRSQLVGERSGVRFINDSKATNVDAAGRAIESFEGVVAIVGGKYKGGRFEDLIGPLAAHGRAVVAIGEARPLVRAALAGTVPVEDAASMDDAVKKAWALARPGGVVLLAPACSSFDMFQDYAARGRAFKAAVNSLGSRGKVPGARN